MTDTFYFSHDYNSRSDVKIKHIIWKFGMMGYGIYWAIIEDLYQNANALRLDYEGIAFDLRVDVEVVKYIIKDSDLFILNGDFFGSSSVAKRLLKREEKSRKASESANMRWLKEKGFDANALQTHYKRNAIKERKGKENKVKEIKNTDIFDFKKSIISLGIEENIVLDYLKVRKTKKCVNTEIAFNSLKSEIEKTGKPAKEVILHCIRKSWGGFEAKWITEDKFRNTKENRFEINSYANSDKKKRTVKMIAG